MSHCRRSETESTQRGAASPSALEVVVEAPGKPQEVRKVLLDAGAVRIGAHPSCDLVLDDPLVSRFHCELRATSDAWQLVDLGSKNGTVLNGLRVRDADLPLRESKLEVGTSVLRVRAERPTLNTPSIGTAAFGRLFGASPSMQRLYARLARVAEKEVGVLIEGESGTGKELVAAEIVARSARAKHPFVVVDCGALSRGVIESELFGHVKGAFTGADRDRAGAFEIAAGGTVFLDEVGELPLDVQPKLLRVLASQELRRLGDAALRKTDVRVVAATNRRLEREVNEGTFREDLYFRLAVVRVEVPPLRERLDDLPLLVGTFLEQLGAPQLLERFTPDVYAELARHAWPGNVRELRNWVERFVVLDERELPAEQPAATKPLDIDFDLSYGEAKTRLLVDFERRYLKQLLDLADGNVSLAARKARMDRMHFHRLLQRHGLRRPSPVDE
jgi:DNA-binding NtrC family response regulator